jgi:hypothetical protein
MHAWSTPLDGCTCIALLACLQEDSASGVDLSTIPIVPELEDPTWFSQDTWRDLPYDYSTLMENVRMMVVHGDAVLMPCCSCCGTLLGAYNSSYLP